MGPSDHHRAVLRAAVAYLSLCQCISGYDACMKNPAKPIRYTIRGVPAEVDHALRLKAAQRTQSLNRVVIDELSRALLGRSVRADFTDLVGKWVPDAEFEGIVASQRQID